MAPPHTSKKHTTTTVSTPRRAHHSPTKAVAHYTDEPTTTYNANSVETMTIDDADTPEGPQPAPSTELQKLVVGMVDAQRARHRVRKQGIYATYDVAHSSTLQGINVLFDEHEAKASEAYDAQLCRLQELIKEKREIEKAMDEKVDELRMVYKKQWRALTKAVQKRLEELS